MDDKYKSLPISYWEEIIKEADKNGDGEVFYCFRGNFKNRNNNRWTIMNLLK